MVVSDIAQDRHERIDARRHRDRHLVDEKKGNERDRAWQADKPGPITREKDHSENETANETQMIDSYIFVTGGRPAIKQRIAIPLA